MIIIPYTLSLITQKSIDYLFKFLFRCVNMCYIWLTAKRHFKIRIVLNAF